MKRAGLIFAKVIRRSRVFIDSFIASGIFVVAFATPALEIVMPERAPMHTFGHPADLDGLAEICAHFRITMVEDAAGMASHPAGTVDPLLL